jgi:hypothetical protein
MSFTDAAYSFNGGHIGISTKKPVITNPISLPIAPSNPLPTPSLPVVIAPPPVPPPAVPSVPSQPLGPPPVPPPAFPSMPIAPPIVPPPPVPTPPVPVDPGNSSEKYILGGIATLLALVFWFI